MTLRELADDLATWDAFWEGEAPSPTLVLAHRVLRLFREKGDGIEVTKRARAAGAVGSDDPMFLKLAAYLFKEGT